MRTTKTLIGLRGSAVWSESSLCAHVRRYISYVAIHISPLGGQRLRLVIMSCFVLLHYPKAMDITEKEKPRIITWNTSPKIHFLFNNWTAMRENVPSDRCAQRRLISACASAQPDNSLRCSHLETLHPWLSKCAQWRFWPDCANARANLNFR